MKRYQLQPVFKKKSIVVSTGGFFGKEILKSFKTDEYQKAVEYVKEVASKNRPSRVTLLNAQGHVQRQWEYAKPKPRVYETKPRKDA